MSPKHKNENLLALIRRKKGLEQKQIAALLGHKTTDAVSRFERGVKMPGLKTALKLGIIYGLPVQVIFYGCCELCLSEVEKRRKNVISLETDADSIGRETKNYTEFCTFEELVKSDRVSEPDLNKARHHIAELVRIRSEKMDHSAAER